MRVRRIEIHRSPGISPGFAVDGFGEGLTIIEGRNESGKSTLATAIQALLWPTRSTTLDARGVFGEGHRTFHAVVNFHSGGWEGDAPVLAEANAGRGMIVGIGDLWQAGDHDRDIQAAMTRELRGGYDLAPLRDAAKPTFPNKPAQDARDARHALDAARNAAQTLMAQEATLPELREQAGACRTQAKRAPLIEKAQERLNLLEELSAQRHELGLIPDGALRVAQDDGKRLESIRNDIDEAQASADREHATAATTRALLAALNLPEHGVPNGEITLLRDLSNQLAAVVLQINDAERLVAEKQVQVDTIGTNAGPLDDQTLSRLDDALNAAQAAREQRNRHKQDADDWTPPTPRGPSRALPIATTVAAVLTAIAAAVSLAWIALGLATLTGVLAIATLMRKPAAVVDPMPQLRERAQNSEKNYQATLQAVRDIAGNDDELASTLSLVTAAKRAARQDKLIHDLHGAKANLESLQAQRADLLQRAAAALKPYTTEACTSPDDLTRLRTDLEDRARQHREYSKDEAKASADASQSETRRDKAKDTYDATLKALGLTEDRLPELHEWFRLRERAHELKGQVNIKEAQLRIFDTALQDHADLLELDRTSLETELKACEAASAKVDDIQKEIGRIDSNIENAKAGANAGQALANLERAARTVAEARDLECAKAASRLILEHAEAGMAHDDMPAIMKTADSWLARFTESAYGLRIERSEPVVYDLRSGTPKGYAELSTGTRAQALLAMRLASAFEAERRAGSARLPLVLDEPLATTDDQRFEAITRAMFELARDGRQLIYLTCEPAHAARLEHLADQHEVPCARLDLDAIRNRQTTVRNPSHVLLEPKPEPSPVTMTREQYLRSIGVKPIDPWASPDAINLYHLLPNDLEKIHALRQHGFTTVGELLAEAQRQDDTFPYPAVLRAALVATRLVRAWREGRSRPVTTQDLIDCPAVTETFLQRIAELNESHGGSARSLIHAIESGEVKYFRKAAELRESLEANGLLPTSPPASRAELLHGALGAAVMGTSAPHEPELLALANRLLDTLDSPNEEQAEAPTHFQA